MEKVKLRELGIIVTGNTPKTTEAENYSSNDICFIKPSDISQDEIKYINTTNFIFQKEPKTKQEFYHLKVYLLLALAL